MLFMRRGKQFYSQHYQKAMELYKAGKSVKDIAQELKISYSCVYHWVHALRSKPAAGALNDFVSFLESNGPVPVIDIKKTFAKHNEFFLRASGRSMPVRRRILQRKLGDYAIWYYLAGQEEILKQRIAEFMEKYNATRKRLAEKLEKIDLRELGKHD